MSAHDTGFVPRGSMGSLAGQHPGGRSSQVSGRTGRCPVAWSRTPVLVSVPVTICSVPCTDTESHDEQKGSLIYLGLKGVNLCLFCAEIQGHPTLQLKVSGCTAKERSAGTWTFYFIGYTTE